MKMSGSQIIAAPPEAVWKKLNDPEVLKRCIPGCQSLEKLSDTEMKASVGLKIGPINATFEGEVTLSDLVPPKSYRISGSGKGTSGFANGGANVLLTPKDGGTELGYDVDANVGGKIAQLGGRLIDATAAMLAGQFFDRFGKEFEPVPAAATATDVGSGPTARPPASGSGRWLWWLVAAIAVAALIAYITTRS